MEQARTFFSLCKWRRKGCAARLDSNSLRATYRESVSMWKPILFALSALCPASAAAQEPPIAATLSGTITEVNRAEFVDIGSIPVRLRGVYIVEPEAGLEFMQALSTGREVECRLTGERWAEDRATLVGVCLITRATDGEQIDLSEYLIEQGLGRACEEPAAVIAIYPPVYPCS